VTDGNTERTRQTLEALAMVDYWRTEAEQQRTRAEAAEQEKHDAMDDAAELAQSCKELEAKLAAIRAHLKGVDVESEEAIFDGGDPVSPATTRCLLAAAREALEQ
jgi:hypothetical protein